ncbi:uncharacterized protein LOC133900813 [Phragmites australis]|uniref:uncharacterized protein LOC133900813 n=1 Tax=Phragmites australis TaxID=29695 RepID=UPI002D774B20|nr:uncharacterized protein LOC133900813 [Phragmites australis]
MASRRFFAYDPYDYYYTAPYHYPYPRYHHQQPAPARGVGGFFPVAADADPAARAAARPTPRSSRSVSIPVHFVGSDPELEREMPGSRAEPVVRMAVSKKRVPSAEAAAVRLQAAARGFLARKTVRTVRKVEREAEEVGGKVAREAEALRGDARARVAVGEALMRLLLRLDAVRGAREYRRRVTKRVLALQDAVDALEPKLAPAPEAVAEETEATTEMAEEIAVAPELPGDGEHGRKTEPRTAAETTADMEVDGDRATGEPDAAEEAEQQTDCANLAGEKPEDAGAEGECEIATVEPEPAAEAASSPQATRPQEPAGVETRRTAETVAAGGVDPRKVMEMVAALCERSAQQCAVIGALAERVDALERAVRRAERRGKKRRKEGKGSNNRKCYIEGLVNKN